jgi:membrane carboxypeptidase/penicillin-binding protein
VWVAKAIGMQNVIRTCRDLGFRTTLHPYISTALGASEVSLLELASVYRAMASGVRADPHVIARVTDSAGALLYEAPGAGGGIPLGDLALIQEGLRGVIRIPGGTAHALSGRRFPIPVMGKTGTTSEFRDALFVGSTYGPHGITVAVRIGFDDNRTLGNKETGGRTALPIFREIMLRIYGDSLVGTVPQFPRDIEDRIDAYIAMASVTPGGNDQRTTQDTETLPSGATTSTTTASIPGKVEAYEAGKTLTITRSDGSRVNYVITGASSVPTDLAIGKTVSILPLTTPGSAEPVAQAITYVTAREN